MQHQEETIVALATPPGVGALAVLRLSGPEAKEMLRAMIRHGSGPEMLKPRQLHHMILADAQNEVLDEVVAAWIPGPRSYTGEDLVEISSHGGPATVRSLLAALYALGAKAASPGEFTYRAFLNGRLDLIQAEAVAELIHSRGEAERRLALKQLGGSLSSRLAPLRESLIVLIRDIEAGFDFAEEDIEFLSRETLDASLAELREALAALQASAGDGLLLREGLSVVLAGSPNVGKSSLFNALLGVERAIVTAEAGTTRDSLRESWQEGGLIFHLEDTAGLREVRSRVERIGVDRSREAQARAQITLWVCDGSRPPLSAETERLETMDPSRQLLVLNKSDLAEHAPRPYLAHLPVGAGQFSVSARDGLGLEALKAGLFDLATGGASQEPLKLEFALNRRQESDLASARIALDVLAAQGLRDLEPELVARQLREALAALDALSGLQVGETILAEIFANFCIGK